jgi:hypothetical protein
MLAHLSLTQPRGLLPSSPPARGAWQAKKLLFLYKAVTTHLKMKKKLFFEPSKKTKIEEYLTISYGKIRDVHILQLGSEVNKQILELHPELAKDKYVPLKNFHCDYSLKKVDKYVANQTRLKYNYQIILPDLSEDEINLLKQPQKHVPSSLFILKGMIMNRKIYIKLSRFEKLILDYQSFSLNQLNTNQKISLIGIVVAGIIGIIALIIS